MIVSLSVINRVLRGTRLVDTGVCGEAFVWGGGANRVRAGSSNFQCVVECKRVERAETGGRGRGAGLAAEE